MAIVGIAGVLNVEVFTTGHGFPYPRVQLPRSRVGKTYFEFGVFPNPYCTEARTDSVFEVVAVTEGSVFKPRARQGNSRSDRWIKLTVDHENVVVARLFENVPGLALNQVTHDIVRNPGTDCRCLIASKSDRLVEHQRDIVMKSGSCGTKLQGDRVTVGPVEKPLSHPSLHGRGHEACGSVSAGHRRGDNRAIFFHNEKLGNFPEARNGRIQYL